MPIVGGVVEVQRQIQAVGARWIAGETALSNLSAEQELQRLGYVPGPNDPSLQEAEQIAQSPARSMAPAAVVAPPTFDWRNVNGSNYVTPIEDQSYCGSCVAFGVIGAVEAHVLIAHEEDPNAGLFQDLSEAHLFFCYGPDNGAGHCPGGGWWPDAAYDSLKVGVADALSFPYTAADQPCGLLGNWQARLTQIPGWHKPATTAEMKVFLSTVGPLTACFTVYADFYHYVSGVYAHVSGNLVGGHCVAIIGYDDGQSCWIAKNSWGTGWGEGGFFNIGYGQCGIDAQMWAPEGVIRRHPISAWVDKNFQHVVHVSQDDHVHELYFALGHGPWNHSDLVAAAGAPSAGTPPANDSATALTSWVDNTTQHVAYVSNDNHVQELYFALGRGPWNHNDLTAATGAPIAMPSALTSWVDTNFQHVVYLSSDGHVQELYFALGRGPWAHSDLTALTGTPSAVPGALTSWVDANYQHVVYLTRDGHVHELYFALGKGPWGHSDLTAGAGAPNALAGALTSWVDKNFQHVVYLSNDGHVQELYFALGRGPWAHGDLSAAVGAPSAVPGALASWVDKNFQHVAYLSNDGHVQELYFALGRGPWAHGDLSAAAGAPSAIPGALTSWVDAAFQHVVYRDGSGHVQELYFALGKGPWAHGDLTQLTGAPTAL